MRALFLVAGLIAATSAFAQSPQTSTTAPKAPPPAATTTAAPAASSKTLIVINSASPADLQALKGIGDVRAQAIVKGRPYKGKDELVQKKIITQAVYDGIKDQIIARQK